MVLIFDAQSEDQFPSLPKKCSASPGQTVPSTTTPLTTVPDIEVMLATAMAAQEQKFQQQLDQLVERNNALETSLKSLTDKLNETINSIIDKTVSAMTGPSSPFFYQRRCNQVDGITKSTSRQHPNSI